MVVHCGRGRLSGAAWSHLPSCWCDTATALSTISNVASGSLVLFSSNIVSVTLKILGNASFSFVTSVIFETVFDDNLFLGSLQILGFLGAFPGAFYFWQPSQAPSFFWQPFQRKNLAPPALCRLFQRIQAPPPWWEIG